MPDEVRSVADWMLEAPATMRVWCAGECLSPQAAIGAMTTAERSMLAVRIRGDVVWLIVALRQGYPAFPSLFVLYDETKMGENSSHREEENP